MIWFKNDEKMVGYVPVLSKEYSNEEILKINEMSPKKGVSSIAKLICYCQGILFLSSTYGSHNVFQYAPPERLIDLKFDFSSIETFSNVEECNNEYIKAIFDLLENLTLYKVQEFNLVEAEILLMDIEDKIYKFSSDFEDLTGCKLTARINASDYSEFTWDIQTAEKNSKSMEMLLNDLKIQGFELSNSIFEEYVSNTSSFFKKRKIDHSRDISFKN